jgi:hypothetical protein
MHWDEKTLAVRTVEGSHVVKGVARRALEGPTGQYTDEAANV